MAPMAGWLHVSIHLWPLRLLVPFPFRYGYDTHAGSRPQAADRPRSVVKGPRGRGKRGEEGRVEVVSRVYPPEKCTRTARSPPAQNSALTISCSSLHTLHIAGQTDMQLALGIKRYQTHYQAPGRRCRGPTRERERRDETALPRQPVALSLGAALTAADYRSGFCDEVPRADSGGPAHRAHPSCWVTPTNPSPLLHPSSLTQPTSPPTP